MNGPHRLSVLVIGAAGYIGREAVRHLAESRAAESLVALDVRETPEMERMKNVRYLTGDVRDPGLADVLREYAIQTVVHLASIVTPGKRSNREFEYSVDVFGTRNVLECCVAMGVRHLVVTSSGAAYGYYADNPQPLHEDDAIRGNPEFTYSDHKRQIEEMLAEYRRTHPELKQLVLRPGTVLGEKTSNQITALFEKRVILGLRGCDTPFVFIWGQDVAACITKGVLEQAEGIYNLAGDGTLSLREIARILGKPYLAIPPTAIRFGLRLLHAFGLTQYGPEQVDFLRYRPVLANDRLKAGFGYMPRYTTRETFEFYLAHRGTDRV
ncbi:MAG TPA: SDR family oxidoreductase [Candidatus Hydrogenedentes bacterium]|nr:SDR family oxidoreductase [Candidatus Hydrogenedentota bacterium]